MSNLTKSVLTGNRSKYGEFVGKVWNTAFTYDENTDRFCRISTQEECDAKEKIIRDLCDLAKCNGWNYGIKIPNYATKRFAYDTVIYFDTPCGQISFHLLNYDVSEKWADVPIYNGNWDGLKGGSEMALHDLFNGTNFLFEKLFARREEEILAGF